MTKRIKAAILSVCRYLALGYGIPI